MSLSSTETSPSPPLPVLYKPLDFINFEFRLLTILESSGDSAEGEVCCKLEHAYLDDPPQYRALSYCCGDASVTMPIQVNGPTKQVTTNLEAALRELRNRKITTVWADALCINQQDSLERGLQVMRMGLIYSKAIEVLAWLGPEADESAAAMESLSNPVHRASTLLAEEIAIHALFSRPYWKRVWIIQEISRAQKVQVLCGSASLSWDRLIHSCDSARRMVPSEVLILDHFRATESSDRVRFSDGRPNERTNLIDAMIKTNSCVSTDVRDKIYALLGLTIDGAALVPTPSYMRPARSGEEDIPASNDEPDWTTLTIGVGYWVLLLKEVRLGYPRSLPSQDNWDTWKKSRRASNFLPPVFCMSGLHASACILDTIEGIASEFPSFKRTDKTEKATRLHVKVRRPSPIPRSQSEGSLVLKEIWQALTEKFKPPTRLNRFGTHGRVRKAAFSTKVHFVALDTIRISFALATLFRGIDYGKVTSSARENARWYSNYLKESVLLKNWFRENRDLAYNGRCLGEWIKLYSETEAYKHAHEAEESFRKQITWLWGRPNVLEDISNFLDEVAGAERDSLRLAVSLESGMTLVPRQTKVGDKVCLLRGSDCPIILRPQGQAYAFIDVVEHYPCYYVDDRMNIGAAYERDWERLHII